MQFKVVDNTPGNTRTWTPISGNYPVIDHTCTRVHARISYWNILCSNKIIISIII